MLKISKDKAAEIFDLWTRTKGSQGKRVEHHFFPVIDSEDMTLQIKLGVTFRAKEMCLYTTERKKKKGVKATWSSCVGYVSDIDWMTSEPGTARLRIVFKESVYKELSKPPMYLWVME